MWNHTSRRKDLSFGEKKKNDRNVILTLMKFDRLKISMLRDNILLQYKCFDFCPNVIRRLIETNPIFTSSEFLCLHRRIKWIYVCILRMSVNTLSESDKIHPGRNNSGCKLNNTTMCLVFTLEMSLNDIFICISVDLLWKNPENPRCREWFISLLFGNELICSLLVLLVGSIIRN